MKSLAPLCVLLVPLAAIVVLSAGPSGAGAVAIAGSVLAVCAFLLVRSEEVRSRGDHTARTRRIADRQFLAYVIVIGFATRAILAITLRRLGLNETLGGDEGTFELNARVFLAFLNGDIPYAFTSRWAGSNQVGYYVFVGAIYWLVGHHQIVPVLVNCLLGSMCAVPAYLLTARIAGRRAGRMAAVLVTFFPSLVIWSCFMVRDAPVLLLLLWCAVLGQSLLRRVSLSTVAVLVLCLAMLDTLRGYIFLIMAGALIGGFLVSALRRPGRAAAAAAVLALAVTLLVRAGAGVEFIDDINLARIDEQRRLNALGGNASIDLAGHDLSTPIGALTYLPIGLLYFLLAPFPWQLGGRQALALPDVVLWYLCLPLVVIGAVHGLRRRLAPAIVPLLAAATISLLYALVEGNVGIIVRHRSQVLVLLLPFAAIGFERLRAAARRRRRVLHDSLPRGIAAAAA